ncbi:uncharacterized protein LOC114411273 [Glycine soja]|uniref:uncharacterized protein LOC114411273 n=1 Tax=Glycine soja TaxID=3848 RepID=UPI00103A7F98|nr:uncharacterized protein LOC114411273 [Glycine soja]
MARIAKVFEISAQELDRVKQNRNGVVGIPRKHLEEKAKALADQGEWVSFVDVLALLVFGVILFPNVDGLVDLAAINAFLAYHHSKESPTIAILADAYDILERRCEKSGTMIVCCTPALYVWLVSHLFRHESRPVYALQGHRMCAEKGKANWEQLLASMVGASINWFPRWKKGRVGVLSSCEGFSNIPLMGMRGCINYNSVLVIRQLGYPMRGVPSEKSITPFIARGFSYPNAMIFQRVRKAWSAVQRKDKELRGNNNGIVGGYYKWLKAWTQELDWLPKVKVSSEEEAETPEESKKVQALKANLKGRKRSRKNSRRRQSKSKKSATS